MTHNILKFAMVSALYSFTANALAEDMYRGAWYLLPGASVLSADSDFDSKDYGGGIFLKLGGEVSPNWDIQGGLSFNRASEDTGIAGVGGLYKQTALGADALYFFSRESFRPFLLMGGGLARNDVDYSNFPSLRHEARNSWMANVGLGAQWLITDRFGVQADLRYQWTKSDAKAQDTSFDASGTMNNTLLNFGAIFRFGGVETPPTETVAYQPPPPPVSNPPKVQEKTVIPPENKVETIAQEKPVPIPCKPRMETVTISAEKLFAFDKAEMNAGAKPLLDEVVTQLKANAEFELVMVTGHTDRIGSTHYNQRLSEKRAIRVKQYLVDKGIDAHRLRSVGKGEEDPKVSCTGVRGKALIACLQPNRRVIIEEHIHHEAHDNTGCD